MKTFSITRRMIAIVILFQLLLTAGLTLIAVLYARSALLEAFDTALEGRAMSALALVRYTDNAPHVLVFDRTMLPPSLDAGRQDLFQITQDNGRFVARSAQWNVISEQAAKNINRFADLKSGDVSYRAVTLPHVIILDSEDDLDEPLARLTVTYATSLEPMYARLWRLAIGVSGAGLVLVLAVTAIAVWSIRRGLAPLRELAVQAGTISVTNWDFRPPKEAVAADELSPLVAAIGSVLDRLRSSFQQQRNFTSDAAHELKTSVAIVKSTLQSMLQRERTADEYHAGLDRVLDDCGRLEDLLERMLRLASVEQWASTGAQRKRATTELMSTCEASMARVQALASARNVSLELLESSEVHLLADPEDLELIWVNLLENAVLYSHPGDSVGVRIHRDTKFVSVSVEDSGPGIPVEDLPLIFERFYRSDHSRARATGGFGLGLAICKVVVEAYGGRIEAINRPERGTKVQVDLPIASGSAPASISAS